MKNIDIVMSCAHALHALVPLLSGQLYSCSVNPFVHINPSLAAAILLTMEKGKRGGEGEGGDGQGKVIWQFATCNNELGGHAVSCQYSSETWYMYPTMGFSLLRLLSFSIYFYWYLFTS